MKKKRRIVPVFKDGKEHAGHVDGWIIHPDDREARRLPKPKAKLTEDDISPEEPKNAG